MYEVINNKFGNKAVYEIKVTGRIKKIPNDFCEDKDVETIKISPNKFKHSIKKVIRDQAELSGLLNTLYDMHLTIISVKCL